MFIVQLDIFDHSHDVMLRNDLIGALQRFDVAAVRMALQRLERDFPADATLTPASVLLRALECRTEAHFTHCDEAREAVGILSETIQPAAMKVLGDGPGSEWAMPLWSSAAKRASSLPYSPSHPDIHCAALWLKARDWCAVATALESIESWRRIPVSLAWMVQARMRLEGLDATWPLLAELAWLAPARLAEALPLLSDPLLDKLSRQFAAEFDGRGDAGDLAWFPAWLLTQKSALARLLGAAQPSGHREPEQVMRFLVECIGLERQGRQQDLIAARKRLRGLHPGLYDTYMSTR